MHQKDSSSKSDGGAGLARQEAEEKAQTEKTIIMLKAHKIFILHRTVMWCDPSCLEAFEKNLIVIPIAELQDVRRRANADDIDFGSWKFIQNFREYKDYNKGKGVFKTRSGSTAMLDTNGNNFEDLSPGLERSQENRIFLIGWNIINQICKAKREKKQADLTAAEIEAVRKRVIIVSSDPVFVIMGQNEGLETQEYKSGNFISNIRDLYTGKADLKIKASIEGMIEMIAEDDNSSGNKIKVIRGQKIARYVNLDQLYPNQCCILNFEDDVRYVIYKKSKNIFRVIDQRPNPNSGEDGLKIGPKNMDQCFIEALAWDKSITLITVAGSAGTGKTISIAKISLDILGGNSNKNVVIFRPIVESGTKLGFLPGSYGEKIAPYVLPVIEAFRDAANNGKPNEIRPPNGTMEHDLFMKNGGGDVVDGYLGSGRIKLESINFVKGRTYHNTVMVDDESQDFTKPETEELLTRIGKNGKIFLTGDLNQIHRQALQPTASGMVWIIEGMKNSERAAHMTLTEVFRNPFVEEITNLSKR
ncbi:MAG TPA: PhoH family protein [Candidatus Moranbacteria bacterium]|nr:PhoH family protein [Candidatus Moranbacteria bacterium]HSA07839.1 PhoH family protein [Candidatus Moranbacteria bacterium]